MEDAGLTEVFLPALHKEADGRLWRSVPSRRWYSQQRGETPGSQEVVLIHQKVKSAPAQAARQKATAVPMETVDHCSGTPKIMKVL
jgi:hypothetical protein